MYAALWEGTIQPGSRLRVWLLLVLILISQNAASSSIQLFEPGTVSQAGTHDSLLWIADNESMRIVARSSPDWSESSLFLQVLKQDSWRESRIDFTTDGPINTGLRFSPDQSALIFTSTGETAEFGVDNWNLWRAEWFPTSELTSAIPAEPFPGPVNSEKAECCAVFLDEQSFLFSSDRDGGWNIYRATFDGGAWRVEKLGANINSPRGEWPSQLIHDGRGLLFSSTRAGGVGGDDLYLAQPGDEGEVCLMRFEEPLNSGRYEDSPLLHGNRLYFSSHRDSSLQSSEVANVFLAEWPAGQVTGVDLKPQIDWLKASQGDVENCY